MPTAVPFALFSATGKVAGATTGRALLGLTIRSNVVTVVSVPSNTLIVIVAEPYWPAAGVSAIVRFAPPPPSTMLPFGTSVTLLELAVTTSDPGAVSRSPTVKGTGASEPPWLIVWSAIAVTVGASFTAATMIVAVAGVGSSRPPASVAVNWKPVVPFQFAAGTK